MTEVGHVYTALVSYTVLNPPVCHSGLSREVPAAFRMKIENQIVTMTKAELLELLKVTARRAVLHSTSEITDLWSYETLPLQVAVQIMNEQLHP